MTIPLMRYSLLLASGRDDGFKNDLEENDLDGTPAFLYPGLPIILSLSNSRLRLVRVRELPVIV